MRLRANITDRERLDRARDIGGTVCYTTFGTLVELPQSDALAATHNLRMEALRALDAAKSNRVAATTGTSRLLPSFVLDIARKQERQARNLIEDARWILIERATGKTKQELLT